MRLRGFLSLGATACLFGLGIVLAKALTAVFNPVLLAFVAQGSGGLLVAVYLLLRHHPLVPRLSLAGWSNLLVLAVFGTSAPLLLVITGFALTSAVVGGVLIQAQGPAAVLLAAILLRERPSAVQLIGTGILILGSVLVVWSPELTWQTDLAGPLLVLAGALGYGFALIPAKRLTGHADALQVSALRLLVGALVVVPLLYVQTTLMQGTLSGFIGGIFALYVMTNYSLAYIIQQDGLRFLKAWEAAVVLQSIPVFTALFAVFLLQETLTPLQIAGGLTVIAGGIIAALGGRPGRRAARAGALEPAGPRMQSMDSMESRLEQERR